MDLVALQNWLDNISFAVLFVTMLVYWVGAAFPRLQYLQSMGTTGMAVANLTVTALLVSRWMEAGYFPISNLYESLFFLCWGLTAVHLLAEYMSRSRLVGVFTSPLAMGITAFAALKLPERMQSSAPLVPALKSNWLMMHVSVMMLSYATLMVGSLLAIAFLIVTRGKNVELHGSSVGNGSFRNYRKDSSGNQMPSVSANAFSSDGNSYQNNGNSPSNPAGNTAVLERTAATTATVESNSISLSPHRLSLAETLDNLSYRIIGLGFPLLTIGIIAGAVWANEAWGTYWSWDPKETWALIVWLVFAAYLHARITKGWQGRKPAILASAGLVVVWICYLGVNLLGKGLHSYGWFF